MDLPRTPRAATVVCPWPVRMIRVPLPMETPTVGLKPDYRSRSTRVRVQVVGLETTGIHRNGGTYECRSGFSPTEREITYALYRPSQRKAVPPQPRISGDDRLPGAATGFRRQVQCRVIQTFSARNERSRSCPMARLDRNAGYGKSTIFRGNPGSMIMHCVLTKIGQRLRVICWPIWCGRAWFQVCAITRIGMASGFKREMIRTSSWLRRERF